MLDILIILYRASALLFLCVAALNKTHLKQSKYLSTATWYCGIQIKTQPLPKTEFASNLTSNLSLPHGV